MQGLLLRGWKYSGFYCAGKRRQKRKMVGAVAIGESAMEGGAVERPGYAVEGRPM